MNTDAGRDALFGDAAQRVQQQREQSAVTGETSDNSYANSSGYGSGGMAGGYGDPGRELTAEELADQEVDATKDEIKFTKQQTVQSARNARRAMEEIQKTGNDTLRMLNEQGNRIHNTEGHLDQAAVHNRFAEEKARELKTLNRSMWSPNVGNPFTKSKREQEAIDSQVAKHQRERLQKEESQRQAYGSLARQQGADRALGRNGEASGAPAKQRNLANRAKYQFEADSDDDRMEDELDDHLYAPRLPLFTYFRPRTDFE